MTPGELRKPGAHAVMPRRGGLWLSMLLSGWVFCSMLGCGYQLERIQIHASRPCVRLMPLRIYLPEPSLGMELQQALERVFRREGLECLDPQRARFVLKVALRRVTVEPLLGGEGTPIVIQEKLRLDSSLETSVGDVLARWRIERLRRLPELSVPVQKQGWQHRRLSSRAAYAFSLQLADAVVEELLLALRQPPPQPPHHTEEP